LTFRGRSAARLRAPSILIGLALAVPTVPAAAAAAERYIGETETGERVKLVANGRGEVVRGAITAITDCSGSFDDFRARVEFGKPLDRSDEDGFRTEGAFVEADEEFSGRYVYTVAAERESDRVLAGTLTLKVTFRRDGDKYTTCRVKDLVFGAERRD